MALRSHLFSLAFSFLLFLFIVELIRRRKLQERYSLLWLFVTLAMMAASVSPKLMDYLAGAVGIYYPPAALFLVAVLFIVALLIHYSLVISKISEQNKSLAQKVALLENALTETRPGEKV